MGYNEKVVISSITEDKKSYKEKLEQFIQSQIFELATRKKFEQISAKRSEVYDYINHELINILNFRYPKTPFEWECIQELLAALKSLDNLYYQCLQFDSSYMEQFQRMDDRLQKRMQECWYEAN